ncbi:MAG: LacI family DNA-binding transcriptional regulator [Paludibacter sp.]
MKEINPKIRIKDIAILAGVSEGTVDRVLHERGDVSAKSLEAVNKVLDEIDYTPNLLARSLASKKQYRFVCLFPAHQNADYWHSVDNGFTQAAREFTHYNVHIEKRYFNQYDVFSFVEVSNAVFEQKPDAVFIAPIFRNETLELCEKLTREDIPFSFIDSLIEEVNFLTYYGQNSFQSGYIAAKLSLSSLSDHAQVLIVRTQRKGAVSNQTLNRYNGFMQFINDNHLAGHLELISVEIKDNDELANKESIRNIFESNNNIKTVITFNSRVHQLAKHLEELNLTDAKLIGYDLLEQNVAYLKKGAISFLIAQRPENQSYFTVRDMCRELIFKEKITKVNYVPIDILIKENIEYYLEMK